MFYSAMRGLAVFLAKILFPFEVFGLENVESLKGGCILCANHLSNIDAIFLVSFFGRKIHFLAKEELFCGIFGKFFKALGAIPVKRGGGDKRAVFDAENILKKGGTVGIFIEGTRSCSGDFLKPRSGAAVLAFKTKSSVIPVCITPKKTKKIRIFCKTVIKIGVPIKFEEFSLKEGSFVEIKEATDYIMEKIKKLRELPK
jgi:1-acyl-sn-glycerol-3-phosphate acyltransferase